MAKHVIIAGAGPVGLTLACELTRFGIPVRIIDKAAARTDKSKALVLWSRTLELLDRGGGSEPFVKAGFKAEAVNFISGKKLIGQVSMRDVPTPYPFGLMIPQSETERLLEERLNGSGIRIERQVELVDFQAGADKVQLTTKDGGGLERHISTPWLIGCDGAHSVVRHGLNLPFAGETMDSDWTLADVHMRGYPCPDNEASVYWHSEGAFVIFPISPGRYRLLADLPTSGESKPPTPTLESVQAIVDRRGPAGMTVFDPIWLAGFRINGRKVTDYRAGRVFLAGDAAHVHSPAGGQGMNTGMQDAFNLAWKLAMVIKGKANDWLLDTYSAERSAVGDDVLKAASRLTTIGTLRNATARALRDVVGHFAFGLASVRETFAETMTEVAIGYPASPLNGRQQASGPKPGERMMPRKGEIPCGSGATPLFALCAKLDDGTSNLIRNFPGLLDPDLREPFDAKGYWLVRPDGYVACSTKSPAELETYLSRLAQVPAR
jgi:2-polyprenyl-6-methoxyphenol hydroxylase-like FAD-dependent oxidoreductase